MPSTRQISTIRETGSSHPPLQLLRLAPAVSCALKPERVNREPLPAAKSLLVLKLAVFEKVHDLLGNKRVVTQSGV